MGKEVQPLTGTRQEGETSRAVQACNDYLRMDIERSLAKLQQKYVEPASKTKVPTKHLRTLSTWSSRWGWVERAEEYDAIIIEAEKNERAKEARETGLALDYERIIALKNLADKLMAVINDGLYSEKMIKVGSGEHALLFPTEEYNKDEIDHLLKVIKDLAEETGGRIKKREIELTHRTVEEKILRLIKEDKITIEQLSEDVGLSYARKLFESAGISVSES